MNFEALKQGMTNVGWTVLDVKQDADLKASLSINEKLMLHILTGELYLFDKDLLYQALLHADLVLIKNMKEQPMPEE